MSDIQWANPVSGNFDTAADWTGGVVPGFDDDAILDASGATGYTVTVSTTQVVASVETAATATLLIDSGVEFSTPQDAADVNAGSIYVGGGSFRVGGAIDNTGTISLYGSGQTAALSVGSSGVTLSGGGTITMGQGGVLEIGGTAEGSSLNNVDNTIEGAGIIGGGILLTNGSAGIINANSITTTSSLGEIVIDTAGDTITNDGLLEATGSPGGEGELIIENSTVDQSGGGTIVGAPGQVVLNDVFVIGGTVGSSGGRATPVAIRGASTEFDGLPTPVTVVGEVEIPVAGSVTSPMARALTIEGTIDVQGLIDVHGPGSKIASTVALTVGAQGATLTGGGLVSLGPSTRNFIEGATASTTLTNDARITGGGELGDGQLTLINAASGVIAGNGAVALTIDTGSVTIENAGLIASTGSGGVTIDSAVDNSGILSAAYGNLTVDATVTGDGRAVVNGATLDFASGFDQSVTFAAGSFATSVLELADSQAYGGTISGFSKTGATELDLDDIGFVSSTEATFAENSNGKSGILTVTDGTHTAHIDLVGDYASSTFVASSDGHGGTVVTDPAALSAPALRAAHAISVATAALSPDRGSGWLVPRADELPMNRLLLASPGRAIA